MTEGYSIHMLGNKSFNSSQKKANDSGKARAQSESKHLGFPLTSNFVYEVGRDDTWRRDEERLVIRTHITCPEVDNCSHTQCDSIFN